MLLNKRLFAVLLLGFSSGLPLALVGSTLQAWFTQAGVGLFSIGTLSLLGIPFALKFLWAPLLDHYNLPRLGRRRGWILAMQLLLALTLILFAQMNPLNHALVMGAIALLIAFFSASQDVAIDAYRTDILVASERGLGAAYFVFSYRIAALFSGGLALILADFFGWKITYDIMAVSILLAMIPTYFAPQVAPLASPSLNLFHTILAALSDLLQREKIGLLLLFIIFYKFGDALALQLMSNFLLHGLNFSLTEIGLAYKVVGLIATIVGAFIGGIFLLRLNIYHALLLFGLAQTFSNLMFIVLAIIGKQFSLMVFTIFIESFCSGLSTAAFFAFLMSLCNHHYSASQYALLSAIASSGRVFLGPLAAVIVEHLGWVQFYTWSFVLCFPGIIFLIMLKDKVFYHAEVATN